MNYPSLRTFVLTSLLFFVVGCSEDAVAPPVEEIAEAPADNDSLASPAVSVFLSPTVTRNFTFSEEISAPAGDAEDFAEFEFPNNPLSAQIVLITLDCTLSGQTDAIARATIFEDGVATTETVDCNSGEQRLSVDNTKVQVARIAFSSVTDPTHLDYALTVVGYR